jgi:hypothetical protein
VSAPPSDAILWVRRVLPLVLATISISCGTPGFTSGHLTCEQELFESSVYDYGNEAVGFATISEAIDDFRSQSECDWQYRQDWQALTPGDMSTTPVVFTDERGWTYLAVQLIRWNDGWLVGGWESCALT